MRVTSDMNVRLMSDAMSRHQSTLYAVRQQMSSGRRVNLASDDPGAYEAIRNLRSDLSLLSQFERNANMAQHYLSTVDTGIEETVNLLHQVNELAVRAADETIDSGTRQAMATEANELLQSLLAVANSSEGGRHVFAGLRTEERPYVEVVDPVTGQITGVDYVGSEESRMIKIGQERYAVTNMAGSSPGGEGGVFQTSTRDLFDSVIRLRDVLAADGDITTTGIAEQLEGDLDHVLNQASLNGARHEQVNHNIDYLRNMQLTHQESLSDLESVDMAEAAMRLSQAQTAYQAALYSSSSLMQQATLLNYI